MKREFRGRVEGLHSPFGSLWSIAAATGWTVDYMLWEVSWATLQLMLADAPRFTTQPRSKEIVTVDDAKKFFKL